MPLEILAAPRGPRCSCSSRPCAASARSPTLAAICEPDVGVITNIGPVHLEQVGSLEGVARAKAELLEGMRDGGTAVVPAGEPLLDPYLRDALTVVRFGDGGDVGFDGDAVVAHGERARPRAAVHRRATSASTRSRPSPRRSRSASALGARGGRRSARCAASGRAPGRRRRHQRLLQRQPAVHACRPRGSRCARARRPAGRGARRHARAGRRRPSRSTARSAPTAAAAGVDAARDRRPAGRRDARRVRRRVLRGGRRRPRRPRSPAS